MEPETVEKYTNNKGGVELAQTDSGFVTWWVDPEGNRFWGHYFEVPMESRFQKAQEDFAERMAQARSELDSL